MAHTSQQKNPPLPSHQMGIKVGFHTLPVVHINIYRFVFQTSLTVNFKRARDDG